MDGRKRANRRGGGGGIAGLWSAASGHLARCSGRVRIAGGR